MAQIDHWFLRWNQVLVHLEYLFLLLQFWQLLLVIFQVFLVLVFYSPKLLENLQDEQENNQLVLKLQLVVIFICNYTPTFIYE